MSEHRRTRPALGRAARALSVLALAALLVAQSGCATMIKGTTQTVTMHFDDPDADVRYYGQPVPDGKLFRLDKRSDKPHVVFKTAEGDVKAPLTYDMDPLLIVDGVLLLAFIVPGVIALAVDFSTGAWRDMHLHQHPKVQRRAASSGD